LVEDLAFLEDAPLRPALCFWTLAKDDWPELVLFTGDAASVKCNNESECARTLMFSRKPL